MLGQRDLGIGLVDLREEEQREEQAEQAALSGRNEGEGIHPRSLSARTKRSRDASLPRAPTPRRSSLCRRPREVTAAQPLTRSEERRVGQEGSSTGSNWGSALQ